MLSTIVTVVWGSLPGRAYPGDDEDDSLQGRLPQGRYIPQLYSSYLDHLAPPSTGASIHGVL
jgi:hypothetical protein